MQLFFTELRFSFVLFLMLVMQACASNQYIVDTKGIDQAQYERDLEECKAYREQLKTGKTVGKSAAFGAVVGAAIGAALGDSESAIKLAGAGAAQGGAGGAIEGDRNKDDIVKNCLSQRGYRVLN